MTSSISRLVFGDNYCDLQVTDTTYNVRTYNVRTEEGFYYDIVVVMSHLDATVAGVVYEAYEDKDDWRWSNPSHDDYEGGFYPAWDIEGHLNAEGVVWVEYLAECNTLKGITPSNQEVLVTYDKGNYKLGFMKPEYVLEYYLGHDSGVTVQYSKSNGSYDEEHCKTYVVKSSQEYGYYQAWPLWYRSICEGILWSEELPKDIEEEEFAGTTSDGTSIALTKNGTLAYYMGNEKVAEYYFSSLTVTCNADVEGFCAAWEIPKQYNGYGLSVSDLQLAVSLGIVLHKHECGEYYGVHPLGTVTIYGNGKFKGEGFFATNMAACCPREVWAKYHPTYGWIPWDCNVDNGLVVESNIPIEGWAPAISVVPVFGDMRAICHPTYGWVPRNSDTGNGLVIYLTHVDSGHSSAWPVTCPVNVVDVSTLRYLHTEHDDESNDGPAWEADQAYYMSDGSLYVDMDALIHMSHINVPSVLEAVIPDALCLGIEAEFSHYNGLGLQTALLSADGKALFKRDSSCGIELVSVPLLPSDMVGFIEKLAISQLDVSSRCGVHIHLTRKELSQSQLGGLVVFMNHPQNLAYITEIAGREPNGFCKHVAGKVDTQSSDRYEMVNLTNRMTIEIRIFAGTNDIKVLQGYVEWLLDLIEWLGTNPVSYLASEFIAYTNN